MSLVSIPLLPAGDIMPAFDEVISPLDDQSPSKTDTDVAVDSLRVSGSGSTSPPSVHHDCRYETVLREPITLSRVLIMQCFVPLAGTLSNDTDV